MYLVTLMPCVILFLWKIPWYQSAFNNNCIFSSFMFYEEDAGMAYCCLHYINNVSLLKIMLTFLYILVL